jgi:hypothetical protein
MRLNAIDTDELKIISTVLKDGLIEVSDVKYLPSIRSFVAMITRFMWEEQACSSHINRVIIATNERIDGKYLTSLTSISPSFKTVEIIFSSSVSIALSLIKLHSFYVGTTCG